MQNDSFKMRPHYAPYNRSEESHRRTDGYIFLALVVGYFANAQYDDRFFVPPDNSAVSSAATFFFRVKICKIRLKRCRPRTARR